MEFSLEGRPFIELNKLIKFLGWTESGGEANQIILDGQLTVNNQIEFRKRCKLKPNDTVVFNGEEVVIKA